MVRDLHRGGRYSAFTNSSACSRDAHDSSCSASNRRCLSVSSPTGFVSVIWLRERNFLHLVLPQRRWLISRSTIAQLVASSGGATITSAAATSPCAIRRLSSARASRTALARSRARSRCGSGGIIALGATMASCVIMALGDMMAVSVMYWFSLHLVRSAVADAVVSVPGMRPRPTSRIPRRSRSRSGLSALTVVAQPRRFLLPKVPHAARSESRSDGVRTYATRWFTATSHVRVGALRACFSSRPWSCAVLDKAAYAGRSYERPGSGPWSASNVRLALANASSAWSSVERSWLAMTLVRSSAPAGGTAGWSATFT